MQLKIGQIISTQYHGTVMAFRIVYENKAYYTGEDKFLRTRCFSKDWLQEQIDKGEWKIIKGTSNESDIGNQS